MSQSVGRKRTAGLGSYLCKWLFIVEATPVDFFKSSFWPFVSMFLYSHNLEYREHFSHIGFMKKMSITSKHKISFVIKLYDS